MALIHKPLQVQGSIAPCPLSRMESTSGSSPELISSARCTMLWRRWSVSRKHFVVLIHLFRALRPVPRHYQEPAGCAKSLRTRLRKSRCGGTNLGHGRLAGLPSLRESDVLLLTGHELG
jgi:hypothetical protein